MQEPPDRPKCGAHSRRTGRPCTNPPLTGKSRCRMHGGASTGSPKGVANAEIHGLYSKALQPAEAESFNRHLKALLADPKTALVASAALIHTHAERLVRQSPDGFLKLEKTRKTIPGESKQTDDGVSIAGVEVEIERTEKHVEITLPLSEALRRASRIVADAAGIEKAAVDNDVNRAKLKLLEQGQNPDGTNITVVVPDLGEIEYNPEKK